MEGVAALLQQQMAHVEKARTMKGKKPTRRVPKEMLVSQYRQEHLASENIGNQFAVRHSIVTLTYAPCTEPLSSLQRVPLTELVLETVHRGKYVLLKTLVEPDKVIGIRTVVEDPEGNADFLSLYNYALDRHESEILPPGIIIALKEPYYKLTAGGGAMLRCDHPQNLLTLNTDDPLVRTLKWKSGIPDSSSENKRMLSFDECRLKGNDLFKQGKFYDAIATYQKGLISSLSEPNMIILRLNRAAALLKVEQYEAALDDCRHVLELNAENEKALYRAAKALYALEQYEQAIIKIQLFAKVTANTDEAEKELQKIRCRLNEQQHGIYDWNMMITEAKKSSTPRLDHASYMGPVRIANISNERGRGMVLTHNVQKGELLLCSKAFQVCYPVETDPVIYVNMETKLSDQGASGMVAQKIVQKLIKNPSLTRDFFDLYAGKHRLAKIPPIMSAPPVIDAFWVGDICSMNVFALIDCDLNPREDTSGTFRYNHLTDSPSALFFVPSYINHACVQNCIRSFIGDMMIVRALDDLQAGTELSMTYTDTLFDLEERQSTIAKHGFICDCRLCELDQAESKEMRNQRKTAFGIFQNKIFPQIKMAELTQLTKRIKETENAIQTIEKTYEESNRQEFQIRLCLPLFVLAKMYWSNRNGQKSTELCMKILKIHGYGTRQNVWTPCLLPVMLQLSLMYYEMRETKLGQFWLEKLRAELCITATGDHRVFAEEYRGVFERLGIEL